MELLSLLGAKGGWILGYVIPFLFVLTIVVFFHELGHFWVARRCGVKIDAFSVGFGPELFGFNDRHGTRWRFAAIPLGGYVRFHGDDSAASTPDLQKLEKMSASEKKISFFHQPVRNRAAIVAAGPIANFILAIVIFAGVLYGIGRTMTTPVLEVVRAGGPAQVAGLQAGDRVISINGKQIDGYEDIIRVTSLSAGDKLAFVVERKGKDVAATITPSLRELKDNFGSTHRIGDIGISRWPARANSIRPNSAAMEAGMQPGDLIVSIDGKPVEAFEDLPRIVSGALGKKLTLVVQRGNQRMTLVATPKPHPNNPKAGVLGIENPSKPEDTFRKRFGVIESIGLGFSETWFVIERTMAYIGGIIVGKESIDQLGGPIRIGQVAGEVAAQSFYDLLRLTAVLSVSIGLLNLFPVPLLDGGHLLFYAIEAIRGRPLSERAQEYGFRIGLAFVMLLMIVATWNDIFQLFLRAQAF
jgi:regulator of sigma E protease